MSCWNFVRVLDFQGFLLKMGCYKVLKGKKDASEEESARGCTWFWNCMGLGESSIGFR